jgi:hypothetical protein
MLFEKKKKEKRLREALKRTKIPHLGHVDFNKKGKEAREKTPLSS